MKKYFEYNKFLFRFFILALKMVYVQIWRTGLLRVKLYFVYTSKRIKKIF